MDVSRETRADLEHYADLISKWSPKINLVAKSTLKDVWARHIIDSIQVYRAAPSFSAWADLGSGGGMPGLVAAIIAKHENPEARFVLVESDGRKATFCKTVIRELSLCAEVKVERIEEAAALGADIVSARALAPLYRLLGFAERHLRSGGTAVFPKGADWEKEVTESLETWCFNMEKITSQTEPAAAILRIRDIERV